MHTMTEEVRRGAIIPIRLRPHERELIASAAERRRVNRTEFMRDAILANARRVLAAENPLVADLS